ncbi:MAG: transposase [Spirulinaceae cyanobacterium RM2_2_10]|nr:transposase [Spirulinaceae cyanobacterium SM2_1_0]NJO21013.1 transposase [Spirulinaceae cyanobacterium RM2_2_10]
MKAYSIDFRQKIVETYENEPISQRQLAARFGVAVSFIEKLLKQYRTTGNLAPKVRTEQTPTKLNPAQLEQFSELVRTHNEATLNELRELVAEKLEVNVSRSTIDRMLKKLGFSRKKKPLPSQESQ